MATAASPVTMYSSRNRTWPSRASTARPNTQRNAMLPTRWRIPPCRNIDENTESATLLFAGSSAPISSSARSSSATSGSRAGAVGDRRELVQLAGDGAVLQRELEGLVEVVDRLVDAAAGHQREPVEEALLIESGLEKEEHENVGRDQPPRHPRDAGDLRVVVERDRRSHLGPGPQVRQSSRDLGGRRRRVVEPRIGLGHPDHDGVTGVVVQAPPPRRRHDPDPQSNLDQRDVHEGQHHCPGQRPAGARPSTGVHVDHAQSGQVVAVGAARGGGR